MTLTKVRLHNNEIPENPIIKQAPEFMKTASCIASHTLRLSEELIGQWSRVVGDTVPQVLYPPTIPFVHVKGHLSGAARHLLSSLIFSDSFRSFVSLMVPVSGVSNVNVLALTPLLTSP